MGLLTTQSKRPLRSPDLRTKRTSGPSSTSHGRGRSVDQYCAPSARFVDRTRARRSRGALRPRKERLGEISRASFVLANVAVTVALHLSQMLFEFHR
jgi:hypothetical protein